MFVTELSSPLARTEPTPPAPAQVSESAPESTAGHDGQAYGVLLRARARGGIYDVVVYPDALVVVRASGTDPVLIGAVLGALIAPIVGAAVGALLGDHIARKSAAQRLHELFYAGPEFTFGSDRRNRFIRARDVRFTRFSEFGPRTRVLELRMQDGRRYRLRFDATFESNSFAVEMLRTVLAPRLRVERHRLSTRSLVGNVSAGLAVLVVSAAVVAMFVAATS